MIRPKFNRFTAAAHFVEGLESWATTNRIEVYPGVVPAGAERYPLITIETDNVSNVAESKDGGTDRLDYDMTVTVAVKEKLTKSGPEWAAELADKVVDLMDATTGEHNGYIVDRCEWKSGAPGYDDDRDCYYVAMIFAMQVTPPAAVEETTT